MGNFTFLFFNKNLKIMYLFLAALDLCLAACGLSLVTVHGLLIAMASLVAEHRL